MPDINNLKEERFILAHLSKVAHRGREGVRELSSSHHDNQEAKRGNTGRGQVKIQFPKTYPK
jgi:hypothetical protein